MRDLAIAYGNSRQAKKWSNKTVKFDDLKIYASGYSGMLYRV